MADSIHYVIQNKTTARFYAHDARVWSDEEAKAIRFDDQTEAEHICDGFRDYFASRAFGYEVAVFEVMRVQTTGEPFDAHMTTYHEVY